MTHRKAQLLELLGAERAAPLVAQAVLAFALERSLAQADEDFPLLLEPGEEHQVNVKVNV